MTEYNIAHDMPFTPCPVVTCNCLGRTTSHEMVTGNPSIVIVRCPVCGPVLQNLTLHACEKIDL